MKDVFIESKFKVSNPSFLGDQVGFMAVSSESSKPGFFLVLFETESVDFGNLNELISQFFWDVKRLPEEYDRRMDKNFTLIICLKRAAFTYNETLNRKIFEIEEDPYHFRKLVLPYSDEEVRDFKENYTIHGVTDGLYRLLNDKSKFYEFKKYPVESTAYNLTSRLFIKLPFLQYRGLEEELEVLSDTIDERLDLLGFKSMRNSSLELIQSFSILTPTQTGEKTKLFDLWLGELNDE